MDGPMCLYLNYIVIPCNKKQFDIFHCAISEVMYYNANDQWVVYKFKPRIE